MNVKWIIFLVSVYCGICFCEIVCLPRNIDGAIRPERESCQHIVNLLESWVEQFGPNSIQTYIPPQGISRPGQYSTPRFIIDDRRATRRTGRLCATKIEVLVGKKPVTISIGEIANTVSNIMAECLIRRRTLGWKRGGSNNRIKIWLDAYTRDRPLSQHLLPNNTEPYVGFWNATNEDGGRLQLPTEGEHLGANEQ